MIQKSIRLHNVANDLLASPSPKKTKEKKKDAAFTDITLARKKVTKKPTHTLKYSFIIQF